MLSERLKELEAEGVVTREVTPSTPVRVEYMLTAKGRALAGVVSAVAEWAGEWVEAPAVSAVSRSACQPVSTLASEVRLAIIAKRLPHLREVFKSSICVGSLGTALKDHQTPITEFDHHQAREFLLEQHNMRFEDLRPSDSSTVAFRISAAAGLS